MKSAKVIDLAGVGIGPFNLSLAALLSPITSLHVKFYEQQVNFNWHPGMLLPNSEIQVSFLKDLVSLVDPTNPYSFLAFLAKKKRLYRFINARFPRVLRAEFNQYLQWVSQSLPTLCFNERVEEIHYSEKQQLFDIVTTEQVYQSHHLVLGHGLKANIPSWAKVLLSTTVFHNSDFILKAQNLNLKNQRVVVIGGGQSGAEIINFIISDAARLPKKLVWLTDREQFQPIDDSNFANELFTPDHSKVFYQLHSDRKQALLARHILASDGVSPSLLEMIYQKFYSLEFIDGYGQFYTLLPQQSVMDLKKLKGEYQLVLQQIDTQAQQILSADIIILCTGYQQEIPSYLDYLRPKLATEQHNFILNADFSIQWLHQDKNKIFLQNSAKHSHGIADPNLSLMAWRSATIINSLLAKNVYDLGEESSTLVWSTIYDMPNISENETENCLLL